MSQETMKAAIDRAQKYIDEHAPKVREASMRQRYHFMGPCGWINDPNGLIYYKGQYHLFYQFNPYSAFWSQMYWGHAVSEDMLHWKQLPPALAPSESYDAHPQGGCFSGSAIEKDGRLYLVYTGAANLGKGLEQTQNIAVSSDGIHFEKYEGNPVVTAPEGVAIDSFRDPKVWEHNGRYYFVCAAQREGRAQALLYRSDDLLHWEFFNVLLESRGEWGYMWECPDFFQLGDKWVFLCSPMGAGERTTVYFVGDFDYGTGKFTYTSTGEVDWGLDLYAPQTFLDHQGRRLMFGWANEWEWMRYWKDWGPTFREGWCGSFSLPREISLGEDDMLIFSPIAELNQLRETPTLVNSMKIDPGRARSVKAGDGVAFELSFSLDLEASESSSVLLSLRKGAGRELTCIFDLEHAEVRIDRNNADGWGKGVSSSPLSLRGEPLLDVRVYSDQSSVELFVGNGTNVHSMNVFAPSTQNGIEIAARDGIAIVQDVRGYGMKSIPAA
ncbi:MAG: glycoside hydrolase family 32 protein [Bifidobacteriaceae bacterium]|nr:glycoside hydrolase family 32 protein [Bifidobacteriaceae bacterium]